MEVLLTRAIESGLVVPIPTETVVLIPAAVFIQKSAWPGSPVIPDPSPTKPVAVITPVTLPAPSHYYYYYYYLLLL